MTERRPQPPRAAAVVRPAGQPAPVFHLEPFAALRADEGTLMGTPGAGLPAGAHQQEPAVAFSVIGHPETQGSKSAFRVRGSGRLVVTDPAKARAWRSEVAAAAAQACGGRDPLVGPVALVCTFTLARPRGHFGSGSRSHPLLPSAPLHPAVRPDADKLLRLICDGLTSGGIWRDDSQAVSVSAFKRYASGEPEGVTVAVFALPARASDAQPEPGEVGTVQLVLDAAAES